MKLVSVKLLSELLSMQRETVAKKLSSLVPTAGPKQAKLYPSDRAINMCLGRGEESDTGYVDQAEANRQLAIKRGAQIDLEMEVTRKERIPLDVLEDVNDRAFSNVAGMLKAHEGKTLTAAAIGDMLSELRSVSESVRRG